MSLITEMRESVEKPIVGFKEFLDEFKIGSSDLHLFYEGNEDEIYYNRIAKIHTKVNVFSYICENKDGVVKVYGLIAGNSRYNSAKKGFFIDRDFDPLLANPDIYETPYYAVENFFIETDVLKNTLKGLFKVSKNNDDMTTLIKLYEKLQNEFHSIVLPLNAYLSCHADKRSQGVCERLDIDEKIIFNQHIVCDDMQSLKVSKQDYSYESLEKIFGQNGVVLEDEFNEKVTKLKNVNQSQVFRGKFEIRFITSFLFKLKNTKVQIDTLLLSKKYKCDHHFKDALLTVQLASFASIPKSLYDYFDYIAA